MQNHLQQIRRVQGIARNIVDINDSINSFLAVYTALDLGVEITDEQLDELKITRLQFTNAVNTIIAYKDLFLAGHNTNLYNII